MLPHGMLSGKHLLLWMQLNASCISPMEASHAVQGNTPLEGYSDGAPDGKAASCRQCKCAAAGVAEMGSVRSHQLTEQDIMWNSPVQQSGFVG